MARQARYKRVLLKLSGESLGASGGTGIDAGAMNDLLGELLPVVQMGVQTAVVVGGGNILRARHLADNPTIRRTTADYMGMMATVMNALALRDSLEARGVAVTVMSAITMPSVCETWNGRNALAHLEAGRMVLLAGGTGSPFFTTDTCAAQRACELGADVLLKATKVDGVFDRDPMADPAAKRYDTLTYQKVLADRLGVMDLTAISLCMQAGIPIVVFKLADAGNLAGVVAGKKIGTIVTS
jgi:uridylate kinase